MAIKMTPTALELYHSSAFWKKRMAEQEEYISSKDHRSEVWNSAWQILDLVQYHYFCARIIEECKDVFTEEEMRNVIELHSYIWTKTQYPKGGATMDP